MPADTEKEYFVVVRQDDFALDAHEWLKEQTQAWQIRFDLANGPLFRCIIFQCKKKDVVFLLAHHLIIDGVSWRILLDDIHGLYTANGSEGAVPYTAEGSYYDWSQQLRDKSKQIPEGEVGYWREIDKRIDRKSAFDNKYKEQVYKHYKCINAKLSKEKTDLIIKADLSKRNTNVQEILLTALAEALYLWRGQATTPIYLESHGRNSTGNADAYALTVGWFTVKYPFLLNYLRAQALEHRIRHTKKLIQDVPGEGEGYLILKYLAGDSALSHSNEPEFGFNYLGHIQTQENGFFSVHPLSESLENIGGDVYMPATVLFTIVITSGHLQISVTYHTSLYGEEEIGQLLKYFMSGTEQLIDELLRQSPVPGIPAELQVHGLDSMDLEEIINSF